MPQLTYPTPFALRLSSGIALAFALQGCATGGAPSNYSAEAERYRELAAQATPRSWQAGEAWKFVASDGAGGEETFVFRITDAPEQVCLVDVDNPSGWKKLELIEGDKSKINRPAYAVRGRNLQVLLSTALCDVYPMFRGTLSESGFAGSYDVSHMLGTDHRGDVYGAPRDASAGRDDEQ